MFENEMNEFKKELDVIATQSQAAMDKAFQLSRASSLSVLVGGLVARGVSLNTETEEKSVLDMAEILLNRIYTRVGL